MKIYKSTLTPYGAEADAEALFSRLLPALFILLVLPLSIFGGGCSGGSDDPGPDAIDNAASPQEPNLPATIPADTASVNFSTPDGNVSLRVSVARSEAERARGLMYVSELPADEGMVFVWDTPVNSGFWMKNTYIPLSIAFVSGDMEIIDIQDMEPNSLESHAPPGPYLYAIEANQGFFADNGITIGDTVQMEGV